MALFEEILADAQVNKEAYGNLAGDILKKRTDAKLNQGQNFNKLIQALHGNGINLFLLLCFSHVIVTLIGHPVTGIAITLAGIMPWFLLFSHKL